MEITVLKIYVTKVIKKLSTRVRFVLQSLKSKAFRVYKGVRNPGQFTLMRKSCRIYIEILTS